MNETQITLPGIVSFKAGEYGFFSETDAGKNFTYYYSFDDGINSNQYQDSAGTEHPPRTKALCR